ncbi:MAG: hypothetical protein FWC05_06535 [Treponema sp.]|nr:hypothetical protein [Treponema sp.]
MNLTKKTRILLLFVPFFAIPLFAQEHHETENAEETSIEISDEEFSAYFVFEAQPIVIQGPSNIEPRSFNDVFPGLTRAQRRRVASASGLRNAFEAEGSPLFHPNPESGVELLNSYVIQKRPSHIAESLILVPYNNRELDMLDVYNALGMIQNIQNQTLGSNNYRVFTETTRIESAQRRRPIPDPAPAQSLPYSETMYLRFTDTVIGEMFIRGDITISLYGLTYSMTNFRDVYYSIFRVMGAERFSAIIYLEPVREGILVYSMAGFYLPGFIVNRLNLNSNINNRITVLMNWIVEGLRRQDTAERPIIPYAAN